MRIKKESEFKQLILKSLSFIFLSYNINTGHKHRKFSINYYLIFITK